MSNFETLSDAELRAKLKEAGYGNLPVSINRDFLIKKISTLSSPSNSSKNRRQTIGVSSPARTATQNSSTNANSMGETNGESPKTGRKPLKRHSMAPTSPKTSSAQIPLPSTPKRPSTPPRLTSPTILLPKRLPTPSPPKIYKAAIKNKPTPSLLTHSSRPQQNEEEEEEYDVEEIEEIEKSSAKKGSGVGRFTSGVGVRTTSGVGSSKSVAGGASASGVGGKSASGIGSYGDIFSKGLSSYSPSGVGSYSGSGVGAKSGSGIGSYGDIFSKGSSGVGSYSDSGVGSNLVLRNRMSRGGEATTARRQESYMKLFKGAESSGGYSDDSSAEEEPIPLQVMKRARNGFLNKSWKFPSTRSLSSSAISMALITIFILFFSSLAFYYIFKLQSETSLQTTTSNSEVKEGGSGLPINIEQKSSFIPLCGLDGVDEEFCIPKEHLVGAKTLFNELKNELVQRKTWKYCGTDVDDVINLDTAKQLLYRLSQLNKPTVESVFKSLLFLIIENPKWGLVIERQLENGTNLSLSKSEELDLNYEHFVSSSNSGKNWLCAIWNNIYTAITYLIVFIGLFGTIYGIYYCVSFYQRLKAEEEKEMYALVEQILTLLQDQHDAAQDDSSLDSYLAVVHIRDSLLAPQERRNKQKLSIWSSALNHILNHESRVREEVQHVKGEEYRVLKWLPSSTSPPPYASSSSSGHNSNDLSPHSSRGRNSPDGRRGAWQGQAFEIKDGGPNGVPLKAPTNCIKVRHMYDGGSPLTEELKERIRSAIFSKSGISVPHIGFDGGNEEGTVYVKCGSKDEAKALYLALHGWWFDGHLLSVKFLRVERYNARFPSSV